MAALCAVISLVVYNAFFSFNRKFTVLHSPKFNICYLISNDYTYEIFPDRFEYAGKKNKGIVTVSGPEFSQGIFIPNNKLNGFEFGYKKLKNFRVREYRLNSSTILIDNFEMQEKAPMHLVPERDRCSKFLDNYKDKKIIFN